MSISGEMVRELLTTAHYGNSVLLAQAAGGNNSVKCADADVLWVKASGVPMSSMSADRGFVGLRLSKVRKLVQDDRFRVMSRREAQEASVEFLQEALCHGSPMRPSLEAGFHACLLPAVVLHVHPVYINAFTCMRDGRIAAAELLPAHTWIPYVAPGFELAVAIADHVLATQEPQPQTVLLLENHGFVAAAASAEIAIQRSETFAAAAQRYFGAIPAAWLAEEPPSAALVKCGNAVSVTLARRSPSGPHLVLPSKFAAFARAAQDGGPLLSARALVPDDVVYGNSVWTADPAAHPDRWGDRFSELAPDNCAMVVPGMGLLLVGRSAARLRALEEMLLAQILVRLLISRRGEPQPLAIAETEYLTAMESEKYRQSMAVGKTLGEGP